MKTNQPNQEKLARGAMDVRPVAVVCLILASIMGTPGASADWVEAIDDLEIPYIEAECTERTDDAELTRCVLPGGLPLDCKGATAMECVEGVEPPECEEQDCFAVLCVVEGEDLWTCIDQENPFECENDCELPVPCGDECSDEDPCEQSNCEEPDPCQDDCQELDPCENPEVCGLVFDVLALTPACPGSPIHSGGHPNGSTWIIWVGPPQREPSGDTHVGYYLSWQMGAATLNNGADSYVAGLAMDFGGSDGKIGAVMDSKWAQANCLYAGSQPAGNADFEYGVQGGAMGYTGTESCSQTASITLEAGIEVSVTGPKGSASVALGYSVECGFSTTFDSEVIFGTSGTYPVPSGG